MKEKIFLYCLSAVSIWVLNSCSSSLPTNSPISSEYFSMASPKETGWTLKQKNDSKTSESIWLQKGHGPGNLSSADYPIKTMLILRKTIPDFIIGENMLESKLYELAQGEVENIIKSFDLRIGFFVDLIVYEVIKSNEKLFVKYSYRVSFPIDSSGSLISIPNQMTDRIFLGNGIGQYNIYLPKFFKEWKSYYLLIYDEFPESEPNEESITKAIKVENKKDPIIQNTVISVELVPELSELLQSFNCIEDSTKNELSNKMTLLK